MKKTAILASAVAAALMAGTASAESSVYGNIRLEVQSQDSLALDSGKLVFGFAGSEDLGNGMQAMYKIEFEHDNADHESGGITNTYNPGSNRTAGPADTDDKATSLSNHVSYVGLKGDFGQVTLGVQGDAAGFALGGTDIFVNNSDVSGAQGSVNSTLDNAIVYANTFGAVTVVLGQTLDGDVPNGPAAGNPNQTDGSKPAPGNHTVIGAMYGSDMFDVGFQLTSPDSDIKVEDQLVIGGTIKLDMMDIGISMADGNGFSGGTQTETSFAVAVAIPAGDGTFKAGIQDTGDAAKKGFTAVKSVTNLQYDYPLSKKVYTGVQYSAVDNQAGTDPDDLIEAWLGMKF